MLASSSSNSGSSSNNSSSNKQKLIGKRSKLGMIRWSSRMCMGNSISRSATSEFRGSLKMLLSIQ